MDTSVGKSDVIEFVATGKRLAISVTNQELADIFFTIVKRLGSLHQLAFVKPFDRGAFCNVYVEDIDDDFKQTFVNTLLLPVRDFGIYHMFLSRKGALLWVSTYRNHNYDHSIGNYGWITDSQQLVEFMSQEDISTNCIEQVLTGLNTEYLKAVEELETRVIHMRETQTYLATRLTRLRALTLE